MTITHAEIAVIFDPLVLGTIAAQPYPYRYNYAQRLLNIGIHRTVVKNICDLTATQMAEIEVATARINNYYAAIGAEPGN
jgi:hypothetical protein